MAYLEWEDADGTGTLTSSWPAGPARRFRGWTPNVDPVGPVKFDLGTGVRRVFAFRTDYTASFSIAGIRASQHEMVQRFKLHALRGGEFYVYTQDNSDRTYVCRLAEGAEPKLEMTDAQHVEYTMSVTVRSIASTPLICDYRG